MKLQTLKKAADFNQFRNTSLYSSPNFKLRFILKNQDCVRFGFIIPNRIVGRVVDRNLIKRRVKQILTQNQNYLYAADILLFPQASSRTVKFSQLKQELTTLLKKVRLWKP